MEEFAILAALSAWLAIWWIVNDFGVRQGWHGVTRHLSGCMVGAIVAGILSTVLMPEKEDASVQYRPVAATSAGVNLDTALDDLSSREERAKAEVPLPVGPEEFIQRLNSNLTSAKLPFRGTLRVEDGVLNTRLSENFHLSGAVDESTGKLLNVVLIALADEKPGPEMGVYAIAVSACVAASIIPEAKYTDRLTGKFVYQVIDEGLKATREGQRLATAKGVRSDVQVQVAFPQGLGMWVTFGTPQ